MGFCDLEVDVNGCHCFFVDKEILASFSEKLRDLFLRSANTARSSRILKVILPAFPGGPEAFEQLIAFCYNGGKIPIVPANVCPLHCAAVYMQMKEELHENNLVDQTERVLCGIAYWTWSENFTAMKQCEEFLEVASNSGVLRKLIDSMVLKITSNGDSSPSTSSPESSCVRFSCDTKSSDFAKNIGRVWWFDDLHTLCPRIIEKLMTALIEIKLDNSILSKFLFSYLKLRFPSLTMSEKVEITDIVVNMLCLLDRDFVPCKGLFRILRMTSSVIVNTNCRNQLENMIGSRLDQATLDDLLIPAPYGSGHLYDVNLVLRFLKSSDKSVSLIKLKGVALIIDKYIVEVAPDSCLKPSKFIALVKSLPDDARDSHDEIYRSLDMYLEVHAGLPEEDKLKICRVLNHEKLSVEVRKHLSQNAKIPSRAAIQALVSQQLNLKTLLNGVESVKLSPDPLKAMPKCRSVSSQGSVVDGGKDQVVIFAKRVDMSTENEKLRMRLEGMQWKVMELEKMCKKMQTQMSKIASKEKGRCHSSNGRLLPRLCS